MLLIVFSMVLCSALASPMPDDKPINIGTIIHAEKTCLATFPPELTDFVRTLKSTREMPENPSDDFKCFVNCMGKELGVIDENGKYHFEKLKSAALEITNHQISHDDAHKVVEECIGVDNEHACEKAHLYVQCTHAKFKQVDIHDDFKTSNV